MAEQSMNMAQLERTGSNKRLPTKEECDQLYRVVFYGNMDEMAKLINKGIDMDAIIYEEYKRTSLHVAAEKGQDEVALKLLSLNVIVDCLDHQLSTPLHLAADRGHASIVACLIRWDADVNARDDTQFTPLHLASQNGHGQVVTILLSSKAEVDARNDEGCTPLYMSSQNGHLSVVSTLIDAKAEVDCICKNQSTPLTISAQNGHNDVVKLLLLHGANPNHANLDQDTPLHRAAYQGHVDVVETLTKHNADLYALNKYHNTPLQDAVKQEKSRVVKYFTEEAKMDMTRFDQGLLEQATFLVELETAIERSKIETKKIESAAQAPISKPKIADERANITLEDVNASYMDGALRIVDPRVVLLGCEGSGKTSLIDTFVGKSFCNTSPTEGAEQMEVSVTTAANWMVISEKDKIADLKKQALLESEFFLSVKKRYSSREVPPATVPPSTVASSTQSTEQLSSSVPIATPTAATPSVSTEDPSSTPANRNAMAEPPKMHPQIPRSPNSKVGKKLVYITKEEFLELKAMKERYSSAKRYVHLWDFAGQQIFHHLHGLFISEDVVCLIVFNAGKSLFTIPDRRYPHDITPAKSAVKVICHWLELITARVSKRSREGDDVSEFLPAFILIGTHIDELDPDIKVAAKLAFEKFVPALIKELESKPFAKHIAGSKNNKLFAKDSGSIFFLSNKDEMRDPLVIGKVKRVIFKAASITRKSRPIRLIAMERKLMVLANQDKMSVINKSLAKEVAESCGLSSSDQELVGILHYFHQKGILLHFHKVPALSNMIILSPKWLAKLLTYVLTTIKCLPVGPPLALYVLKLQRTGLLEQELLKWSIQQFVEDEATEGHKMIEFKDTDFADLLINFKLMVNVSDTSLAGQSPRVPGCYLYLVPHLLPKEDIVYSKAFGYFFYYYFPAKFIPEHLVDQLIVRCAEWNRSKQYDLLKLSLHWACMELGKHQIFELDVMFDHSFIIVKIIPEPNLSLEAKEKGFADSNELVRSVRGFIDDLMKQHMTATFGRAPVICYVPCSRCRKMHLKLEKVTESGTLYCPVNGVHADVTDYHKILSAHLSKARKCSLLSVEGSPLSSGNKSQPIQVQSPATVHGSTEVPTMKLLHQLVIPNVAAEWKTVADYLEFELPAIEIIQKKCRNDPMECCTELFRQWLSADCGVGPKTWSTLITALKGIKQLTMVTEQIQQKLGITTDQHVESQGSSQSYHEQMSQIAAATDSSSVSANLASLPVGDVLKQAPKMKHLNKYVIPKIAADWKQVADSLEFEVYLVRTIDKKFPNNPPESCDDMMRIWLSSDVGVKPKTWSTLIAALKDVKQLTAVVEEIEEDIKRISS